MVALLTASLLLGGSNMIQAINQRLDRALYAGHPNKLVVAGRIVDITTDSPQARVRLHVDRVVLGDAADEGRTLSVSIAAFAWPGTLVPARSGTACVLVLRREPDRDRLYTVVPVADAAAVPRAADGAQVERVLAREILAVLAKEVSPGRQRELILQVAPILRADEAPPLVPYLASGDPWLRRAALGALTYATGAEPYLRQAATDVQRFFTSTRESDLIDGIEPGVRYAAYPFFYRHYFFLEPRSWRFGSRWTEEEAARNLALFRALRREGLWTDELLRTIDPDGTGRNGRP